MPFDESRMTAVGLVRLHQQSHTSQHWSEHAYTHAVVINGVRCCLCVECFDEMFDIAAQLERDYNSMLEDLRRSARHFLGFDIYEEWKKKTR
jgi:hypothetical protein